MSENKNSEPLSTAHRLLAITGLASIAITGGTVAPEQTDGFDLPINTNEQVFNTSAIPTQGIIDKAPINESSSAVTEVSPYKKSITISLPSAEKVAPTASESTEKYPVEVILPPLPVETTPSTIEKVSLHPEDMVVPENVKAIMDRDTVYITTSGCSGSLVRNKTGVAIGEVGAEHCGLRGSGEHSTPRILGTDGNTYIVTGAPVEVMTGPDQSHLKSTGTIKEFFVPAANDISNDIAFGAFDGHTAQEVVAAYNHNKLSASELSKLKLGDRMYISGWPVAQPENGGNFERQNFPLSYLGDEMVTTSLGETIHMIWAAVPTSKDGAECSFGNSGGKAFVMKGVHSRSVGVLAAFIDFTGKLWGTAENGVSEREYFEKKIGVNLIPFSAICGIATEIPAANEGAATIKTVTSATEIPGYVDSLKEKALTEFLDPNYVKTILNGAINVAEVGTFSWKFRPVVFYEPGTNAAILVSYNPALKDGVELDYIDNLLATPMFGAGDFIPTSGELGVFNGKGSDGFVDQNGQVFGESYDIGTFPDLINGKLIHYDKDTQKLFTTDLVSTAEGT